MKKIYIILTQTGTIFSKVLKLTTRQTYNHVSIAMDEELKEMYSFGRLNPYVFFLGGFVHEGLDFGTFKRFYLTTAKISYIEVNDDEYTCILKNIRYFNEHKNEFSFNFRGVLGAIFKHNLEYRNRYYCSQFVKYLLKQAEVEGLEVLPEITKPQDFDRIKSMHIVYQGLLQEYNPNNCYGAEN